MLGRRYFLILLAALPLAAADPVAEGWDHFYNLDYAAAVRSFRQSVAAKPADPSSYNYLAQAILYGELYRLGVLESEMLTGNNYFLRTDKLRPSAQVNSEFLETVRKAIDLARLRANQQEVRALYALGSSYGLLANYEFMVQKNWKAAVSNGAEARNYHRQVLNLDPRNYDAMLIQGVYDYVIGSLPWHARLLAFLIGRTGDKNHGLQTIAEVADKGALNKVDAQVMLAILYRREKRPADALRVLAPLLRAYPRNYLFQMEQAHMHSDLGHKDDALAILRRLEQQATSARPDIPREKVYYAIGDVQFWYRDFDDALANMRRVTEHRDLDLHTGALAWMRQGQILDLIGRREEARQAYRKAMEFAPQTAAAEESRKYLSSPYRRQG
jgi:tetratricopeptide (TPR) repeat protein